eukprot:scaffold138117_cov65-Attheya_sp.AAC.3
MEKVYNVMKSLAYSYAYHVLGVEDRNTVGNGLGTAYIFEVLITKALLRSKHDNVGNELEEGAVEYVADEISDFLHIAGTNEDAIFSVFTARKAYFKGL